MLGAGVASIRDDNRILGDDSLPLERYVLSGDDLSTSAGAGAEEGEWQ